MKAVILGNADIGDYAYIKRFIACGLIICCDGGVRHARTLGITPDVIIGDFDSADTDALAAYKNAGVPFESYPSQKEETDMELCLQYAIKAGANEIEILGGIGSRLDHTLANVFLLRLGLQHQVSVRLIDEHNIIQLIDKELFLTGEIGEFVSVLPMTQEVRGVRTRGLAYPLRHETLFMASSRGISNQFSAEEAHIQIDSGLLLVIRARD